jgi:hypothetical protein
MKGWCSKIILEITIVVCIFSSLLLLFLFFPLFPDCKFFFVAFWCQWNCPASSNVPDVT